MTALPNRLTAAEPGWTAAADVVVIGSGVAGLTSALHARAAGLTVILVTKSVLDEGSTRWAQGGIAAALSDDDSPSEHMTDTLIAGGGLCDADAVQVLVENGPAAIMELVALGARFDQDPSGALALGREGGHLKDRIAHAGGDATGAEISRALVAAVEHDPGIDVMQHTIVLDLLLDADGAAQGVTVHSMGGGARDGVGAVKAPNVILATGGFGQVFGQTTNPHVATGDGVALALRAGADIADLEFVQFHPTVLYLGPLAQGQQPLVSEAVRGEGAILRDGSGRAFMADLHPLADLAPRDVVAKAITSTMRAEGSAHVWLDGRHLGADTWLQRFPNILAACRQRGIDPVTGLIPVGPAQHYASGGVRTDLWGRSTVPGLYACGEVACTGVHGANRLASNSLLEGLVFSKRIVAAIGEDARIAKPIDDRRSRTGLVRHAVRREMQRLMDEYAGVLRSAESLTLVRDDLDDLLVTAPGEPCTEDWETTNLHALATVLVQQALLREETRGSHWRTDFPETDDAGWQIHLVTRLDADGALLTSPEPVRRAQVSTP
jgi:L-aspartate oxidase